MHPKLGDWAGVPFYSQGTMLVVAGVLCLAALALLLRRRNHDLGPAVDLAVLSLLGYWLGARLLHALLSGKGASLLSQGPSPGTWGGQIAFGGLALAYLLSARVSFRDCADALAVAWAFFTVPVKLGCYLAGCCHGTPTTLPWGIRFPEGSFCSLPGIPVHPTQLYDAVAAFLLGAGLLVFFLKGGLRGRLLLWFGLGYSVTKFLSEQVRADRRLPIGGTLTMQMAAELVAIAGVVLLLVFPRFWSLLLERQDFRVAPPTAERRPAGRLAIFLRELAVAAAALAAAALLGASIRAWPMRAFAGYMAVFIAAQTVLALRGRLVDLAGRRPGAVRLFARALVQALAVFTGLALLRPLFDREARTAGDALSETWPTPPIRDPR